MRPLTTKGNAMDILYTAEALSTGAGRDGHVTTTDGRSDFDMAIPKEMGGSGNGANPEPNQGLHRLVTDATSAASTSTR